MRFGSGPWGAMPFGGDPPSFAPDYTPVPPPAAMSFAPLAGDFVQNAQGQIADMGTIEQAVTLAFSVPRGSLAYATDVGHDFLTVPRQSSTAALDAAYLRCAQTATPFDQLISRGLVELVGITTDHPKDTESRIFVNWRKTGSSQTRTTPVGSG